ncbi:MAG: FadR/GntR family transcriptional regulator [Galactobacter sp.]
MNSTARVTVSGAIPKRETSRSERVAEYLRGQIVERRWSVGERIPTEPELMEELGVGRGAVREGVRSLVSLGILEPQVSRGTFVRSLTPVGTAVTGFLGAFDLSEVIGFRRALEVQAAHDAALRQHKDGLAELRASLEAAMKQADSAQRHGGQRHRGQGLVGFCPGRFHAAVFAAANNPLYEALYGAVMDVLLRAQAEGELVFGAGPSERGDGHREVLAAIEAGDADGAGLAMGRHVDVDLVEKN